jgi:vacuolar iron transporter family protein
MDLSDGTSSDAGSEKAPLYDSGIHDLEFGQQHGDHRRRWVSPRVIADATIGLSDGLTVPFALSAGLSGLGKTNVVIIGGLAELMAGAISMGVGGYLAAKGEVYVCCGSSLSV